MGKGGSYESPPMVVPPSDNGIDPETMAMMGSMMQAMQAQVGALTAMAAQPPQLPPMPESAIAKVPDIDWDAKRQELLTQEREKQARAAAQRYGIKDTLLSPLLDEEEPDLLTVDVLSQDRQTNGT